MLHRIQINGIDRKGGSLRDLVGLLKQGEREPSSDCDGPPRGPSCSPTLDRLMRDSELPTPDLGDQNARFYFTDAGWKKVGEEVMKTARQLGYSVRYIRRRDMSESEIVYRDDYQVAIALHRRRRKR